MNLKTAVGEIIKARGLRPPYAIDLSQLPNMTKELGRNESERSAKRMAGI